MYQGENVFSVEEILLKVHSGELILQQGKKEYNYLLALRSAIQMCCLNVRLPSLYVDTSPLGKLIVLEPNSWIVAVDMYYSGELKVDERYLASLSLKNHARIEDPQYFIKHKLMNHNVTVLYIDGMQNHFLIDLRSVFQ